MELTKKEMASRVSILYYEKNKSQNEIAKEMDISRSYVSQLLNYARECGIVKISINIDEYSLRMIRKEVEFKAKFPKLKQVFIMNSESDEFTVNNIGKFAAPYVTELINDAKVIGINLGTSVEKTIENLEAILFGDAKNKKVVQMMGGFNNSLLVAGVHPNELVGKLSTILNCEAYYLNCPVIIEQSEIREALLKEKSIETVINIWGTIDLAIMGIGVADVRSKLFKLFNKKMINEINKRLVCCDLNTNFFNEKGEYISVFDDNKISISYPQLKKIKKKVIISYGEYKSKAILSALKGEMIDILITDSITIDAIENNM